MTEATVRSTLVKKLRLYKDWFVLRHEDHYTSGVPDISITGNKITSWSETKFQRGFSLVDDKGIKKYTLDQLNKFGYARYIIYTPECVAIVAPDLFDPLVFKGHDHLAVVKYFRELHGLNI